MTTDAAPKLFISYSWDSQDHQDWVVELATQLRQDGVDVILDKWDLKEGQDSLVFMEQMVTDDSVKKVLLISTKEYEKKSDKRHGGVGTEAQIISPQIYKKSDQSKFVLIVKERDENGDPYLPTFYPSSRIFIDLSSDDSYTQKYEELLRWLYDQPIHVKPSLGSKPAFIESENNLTKTLSRYKRAISAISHNKGFAKGAISEFFKTILIELEQFRIDSNDKPQNFDEKVMDSIDKFLPYRNEIIDVFLHLIEYRNGLETYKLLHQFFSEILVLTKPDLRKNSYRQFDFDNFKFIAEELFITCIAIMLNHQDFEGATYLLRSNFYTEQLNVNSDESTIPFCQFKSHLDSFDNRNQRLQLRRVSLKADKLKERCKEISFYYLMQADFVMHLRHLVLRNRGSDYRYFWYPDTLVYFSSHHKPFQLFAHAESRSFFDQIKPIFDINSKEDLLFLCESSNHRENLIQLGSGNYIEPKRLVGYDKLCSIA